LRLCERRLRPATTLILGIALMGSGLAGIALAASVPALLGCIAVFSLGSILASPSQQTVTASLANPVALGSFFGVASLGLAFGGGIGNFAGGLLYGLGDRLDLPAIPWLCFGAIGLGTALGLLRFQRRTTAAPVAVARREVRTAGGAPR
jgi:DHA1 family multidrug resistance protein-like MFS transporter